MGRQVKKPTRSGAGRAARKFLDARAKETDRALRDLATSVEKHLADDRDRVLAADTCVYVVGSGGRGEMSEHSDVDLFVARVERKPSDLDALHLRQAIARALHAAGRPEPSQGGAFLEMHTSASLCGLLGTPADDAANTLTARMLLLLESKPLVGDAAYEKLLTQVLAAYWKDAETHAGDFQPFVLVNDIIRYWRILLLNYVAKNTEKERELTPPDLQAERRIRGYKLRMSRCMTCFSVLAALLDVAARGAVTTEQVQRIVKRRPVERLLALGDGQTDVDKLLEVYATFLKTTAAPKKVLQQQFTEHDFRKQRAAEGRKFGEAMFALLQKLGRPKRGRELFRHMIV